MGLVTLPEKLVVSSKTCDAVKNFNPLRTTIDVHFFIGLCNVFRLFVLSFARISAPLNKKLTKSSPSRLYNLWDDETTSFDVLKARLVSPSILAIPRTIG